ncbi:hypothetical protein PP747_gp095 [Rhizobium phage RHph_Y38]|uniref:Uncharacterized protein n=1 Tax=Rhizobium phage RHph_Y38 TaxID=2509781 RepID=A0A7S5US34_9CAUD|nr:hypothetical protein PP747_gp095 [Rhizobium phage RHph_Y38]QIG67803.1 hypothetical protein EVB52_104 [Rhizobium phage RHph_Y38]
MQINEGQLKRLLDGLGIEAAMAQDNYIRVHIDTVHNLLEVIDYIRKQNKILEDEVSRLIKEKNNLD